ncbi:MAG: alpha/beta hydrolase [Candidatus Pacebacteria bacterium]|nr:alpha/beta hydrolase [Candidatus Paceibacterota bacterium]
MQILVRENILKYEQIGHGDKNLLILHGWGRSLGEWVPVAHSLTGYTITILDLPGFGGSSDVMESMDTYAYAEIVLEFMKKLELSPCVILGHSFGGRIATILASQYPDVVSKIILVDAGGIEIKSFKIKAKILFYKLILKHFKNLVPRRIRNFFGSSNYRALSGNLRKSFVKIVNQDLRLLFSTIKQPVSVIWGSNDGVLPVQYVKIYRRLIPQALIRIVWNAGHCPHVEKQKDFIGILKEVL